MGGIGVVTNPHSRRNRRYPEQVQRLAYVLGKGDEATVTRSVEDVDTVARRFRDAEIDILALNGGDGTNHVTLTSFLKHYGEQPLPLIALLRGGTLNTISNGIGIQGKPNSLLVNIVEKYYLQEPFEISERDLLKITTEADSAYGFLFGSGLIANFMREYYGTGKPNAITGAKLLVRGAASAVVGGNLIQELMRPTWVHLTTDEEPWIEGEVAAVTAATIEQIGLGFRPWIRCEAQPGLFHVLVFRGSSLDILRQVVRIRLGRPLPQSVGPDRITRKLVIESDEPIEYTIDGDMYVTGKRITLENGPRLKIIVK
ncbi:MAG: hypothetical protein JW797_02820 [Bradymonadales bacterium]|nr:hypothetical protein [Bradymonadales bacterium]